MTSTLGLAMLRLPAMEKQALSSLSTPVMADAVPFFPWEQEAFPYFSNWWQGPEDKYSIDDQDEDASEDIGVEWHVVVVRLVIAHLTGGYSGENQANLYDWAPVIQQFFRAHPFLTSTEYPSELDYISPVGVQISDCTGIRVFSNAGISAQQIGCEWTLRIPIMIKVF